MLWAGYISDSRELIGDGARRPGPAETREARASRGVNDSIVAAWAGELGGVAVAIQTVCSDRKHKGLGKVEKSAWCLADGYLFSSVHDRGSDG